MFQIVSRPDGGKSSGQLSFSMSFFSRQFITFHKLQLGHVFSILSYSLFLYFLLRRTEVNFYRKIEDGTKSQRQGKRSKIVQTIESPHVSCCCAAMEWAKTENMLKTRATCWVFQELPPAFRRWICYNSPKVSVLHNRSHESWTPARLQANSFPSPVFPWRWRSFSGMKLK